MLFLVHNSTKLHHPREPPDFSLQGIELDNLLRSFATKPSYESVILSKDTRSLFENKGNAAVTSCSQGHQGLLCCSYPGDRSRAGAGLLPQVSLCLLEKKLTLRRIE